MNLDGRRPIGRIMVCIGLLLIGSLCDSALVWARGTSLVAPPVEIVGEIREVDRMQGRVVMVERDLEVWATDRRQLDGLAPGQKVRLRYQQQDGKQIINSIVQVTPDTK